MWYQGRKSQPTNWSSWQVKTRGTGGLVEKEREGIGKGKGGGKGRRVREGEGEERYLAILFWTYELEGSLLLQLILPTKAVLA